MDGQRSFDDYRMPDELWEQMEEILPGYPSSPKCGRPRADLRGVADAIFYRLRTGANGTLFRRNWLPAAPLTTTTSNGLSWASSKLCEAW